MRHGRRNISVYRTGLAVAALAVAAVLGSCSGDSPTGPTFGPPAALLIEGGQDQAAVVGSELPTALTARVVDANGRPVRGQAVNFRVVAGGGSVFAGVAITSDSGIARERWTLGTSSADSQRVEARAVNEAGSAIVFAVFRATARPDVPASIIKVAGDTQTVVVGTAATDSLTVRVLDRFGNPVPQTTVRWAVESGGGAVSADSSVTDAQGLAKTRWTVGQQVSASQRVTASVGSLAAQTFQATVQAAAAVGVEIVTPAGGAASGAPFTTAPRVRLVDAFGNTAVGSTNSITLAVSAGGTLLGTTTVTPTNGEASFTGVGLSGSVGDYTLTYAATGLTAASQSVALIAGAPTLLVITTQPAGAVSGSTFATQPVVELRDNAGNRTTSTATVTASVASGGGTLQGTAVVAAVSGVASFMDLRIDLAAVHTLTFTVASSTISLASEAFSVTPGSPARLRMVQDALHISLSGSVFAKQPVVEIVDNFGNRVSTSSAAVRISSSEGTSLIGAPQVTASEGLATFTDNGISGAKGVYTLAFSAEGIEGVSQPIGIFSRPATITAGFRHSCGIVDTGTPYCWGLNADGQLGDGTSATRPSPARVTGNLNVVGIAAGLRQTCALSAGGEVACWGNGISTPTSSAAGRSFASLRAGPYDVCGLTGAALLYCGSELETLVSETRFSEFAIGDGHKCAIDESGVTRCWGRNDKGQLGDDSFASKSAPTPVAGSHRFVALASGWEHTCALTEAGAAYCWGFNRFGQVGDGSVLDRGNPTPVSGGLTFVAIAVGYSSSCGITADGDAYCWGAVFQGFGTVPSRVPGDAVFRSLAQDYSHTCALAATGSAWCWGGNDNGQLGNSTFTASYNLPVQVGGGLTFLVP